MMNSYPPNRHRRGRRVLFIGCVLVVCVFFADTFTGGTLGWSVRSLAGGLWTLGADLDMRIVGSGVFATKQHLSSENQALRAELSSIEELQAKISVLQTENDSLRQVAHLAPQKKGIAAPVVSSFKTSPYGTFYIGAGSKEGILKGATVVSAEGFILGVVSDVSGDRALVTEVFAPRAKVDVLLGRTPLTITGSGGGNAFGEAPRGTTLATDTPALASSFGQRAVGIVERTEGGPADSSVKVYVRTPVNLESLSIVYVEL